MQVLVTPCASCTSLLRLQCPHQQTEPGSYLAVRLEYNHLQLTIPHKRWLIVFPRAAPHTYSLSGCPCLASARLCYLGHPLCLPAWANSPSIMFQQGITSSPFPWEGGIYGSNATHSSAAALVTL